MMTLPLGDKNYLRCVTICHSSDNEHLQRYVEAVKSINWNENAAPNGVTIARINSVHLSGVGHYNDFLETELVSRQRPR